MEKWRNDEWFVSPWNFEPEIQDQYSFSDKLEIHDTTLRDGEQQMGVAFNCDDKVAIAEMLAEAGVQRIEVGMPAVSEEDEKALRILAKRDLGNSKVYAFARCMVSDVKLAVDCGAKGIVTEVPSSAHIIEYGYQWPLEKAIESSVKATSFAHENGLETIFFTIDASRGDMDWVVKIIREVSEQGHMDGLVLVDTMGVLTPESTRYYVKRIQKEFPGTPLHAHFHNDFGLGLANTITALSMGVEVAHTTVCGLGERAGGVALEQLVVALEMLYGVHTGIKMEMMKPLADLVVERSGHVMASNQPVVGDDLFTLESGIPVTWLRRCHGENRNIVFPFLNEAVGQKPPQIALGKGSGEESIRAYVEDLRMNIPEEDFRRLNTMVKEKAIEKKGCLTLAEFKDLVLQL